MEKIKIKRGQKQRHKRREENIHGETLQNEVGSEARKRWFLGRATIKVKHGHKR